MLSGERLLKRLRHYPDIPACGRAVPRTKYPRTLQKGTGIFRSRSRLFLEGLFFLWVLHYFFYEGENETYIEASVENSSSILYDKEIRNKPRTRRTKRNV